MSDQQQSSSNTRARMFRIGDRQVLTRGLSVTFWGDFYHNCMIVSWPVFFAGYLAFFLSSNCVFAILYLMGTDPIANARPWSLDLFFFSIETLATVGYGDMHPQSTYAHVIATVEIFFGLSMLAVVTGLVFQRFARPRARILFAQKLLMTQHEGKPTFMVRMANERHNAISNATAKLWYLRAEVSAEGQHYRRFHTLRLDREQSPIFSLSWTLFHVIDEQSLLWNMTAADFEAVDASFLLTVTGHDETSGQDVHVRQAYTYQDIVWNHRYLDILGPNEAGVLELDYTRFHMTEALPDRQVDVHAASVTA